MAIPRTNATWGAVPIDPTMGMVGGNLDPTQISRLLDQYRVEGLPTNAMAPSDPYLSSPGGRGTSLVPTRTGGVTPPPTRLPTPPPPTRTGGVITPSTRLPTPAPNPVLGPPVELQPRTDIAPPPPGTVVPGASRVPILFNPVQIPNVNIEVPPRPEITIPEVPRFNFTVPPAGPPITIDVPNVNTAIQAPTVTPPPDVAGPTYGQGPDQRFQDLIRQYVANVQQQGTGELDRLIREEYLPTLKSSAAASGQISPEGQVSGPFLENLMRLAGQSQRATGEIVLGAETQGLDRTMGEFARLDQRELEDYRARLNDAVSRGQLSVSQADLALRAATAQSQAGLEQGRMNLQGQLAQADITAREREQERGFQFRGQELQAQGDLERMKAQLQAALAGGQFDIERFKAQLQAQVASGQLSLQGATLAFQQAKEQADQITQQQALQLKMMDILGGQQISQSQIAAGAIGSAETQRLQQLLALIGVSGTNIDRMIQAAQAMKAGGGTTTQTESGDVLRDLLGMLGIGAAAFAI